MMVIRRKAREGLTLDFPKGVKRTVHIHIGKVQSNKVLLRVFADDEVLVRSFIEPEIGEKEYLPKARKKCPES